MRYIKRVINAIAWILWEFNTDGSQRTLRGK
jgi:hypothetical protein